MKNKKYLTEDNYEKVKNKILKVALIVLIVGVLLGVSIIILGVILSHNAKGFNIDLNPDQGENVILRTESEVQSDINAAKVRINSLNAEIAIFEMDLWSIQTSEGLSDNYYAKQRAKEEKQSELLALNNQLKEYQNELKAIQSQNSNTNNQIDQFENIFNSASNKISKARYIGYYTFGGFIIIVSCLVSGCLYIFAKKREIAAFTTQQVMPIAKEGIDEMAPTVGNVVKDITKGIKDGLKDEKK